MTPLPLGHFQLLASYNSWANDRLYSALFPLPESEITKPRPAAFFDTMLGTLNHIYVGDSLWLARLSERPTPAGWTLDHTPYGSLRELWQGRQKLDTEIIELTDSLTLDRLEKILSYETSLGEPQKTRVDHILTHVFNHQTHHRGQAHALLSDMAQSPPPLDLIYYLRELGLTGG